MHRENVSVSLHGTFKSRQRRDQNSQPGSDWLVSRTSHIVMVILTQNVFSVVLHVHTNAVFSVALLLCVYKMFSQLHYFCVYTKCFLSCTTFVCIQNVFSVALLLCVYKMSVALLSCVDLFSQLHYLNLEPSSELHALCRVSRDWVIGGNLCLLR